MSVPGREPVEATERKRLTAAQKAHLLERQQHRCAGPCQQGLVWALVEGKPVYGPMIDENIIPLQLGGSNGSCAVSPAPRQRPGRTARPLPRSPASAGVWPVRNAPGRRSGPAASHVTRSAGRTSRRLANLGPWANRPMGELARLFAARMANAGGLRGSG